MYIQRHINIYKRTHIRHYMNTCIQICIRTCVQKLMHVPVHTYTDKGRCIEIRVCISTRRCTHTYRPCGESLFLLRPKSSHRKLPTCASAQSRPYSEQAQGSAGGQRITPPGSLKTCRGPTRHLCRRRKAPGGRKPPPLQFEDMPRSGTQPEL